MTIKYLKREEIDKVKWNSCVHFSSTSNIFGYTWYLDNVAKEWDGLIEGDYESVFPIIKKSLYFNTEIVHQPDLLPKAGLYSIHVLSTKRIQAFIENIPKEYQYIKVHFHHAISNRNFVDFPHFELKDYQLMLNQSYEMIQKKYSDELVTVLNEENEIILDSGVKPETLADFYMQCNPKSKEAHRHTYMRIIYNILHRGTGFSSVAKDKNGKIIAADFFAFENGKMLSLMPSYQGEQGKKALWKLYDMMIQSNANKPLALDFNTAMGDAGAETFGAEQTKYQVLHINQLPIWKKWMLAL